MLTGRLDVPHIGSGDLFRRHVQQGTPLGLRASRFMNQGSLVPDEVTIRIILEKVLPLDAETGFILDGFPRNPLQALALEEALNRDSRDLDKVVHIDVPASEVVRRLGKRFSCRQCQAPQTVDPGSPKEVGSEGGSEEPAPRCRSCGGELYQRADDSPKAVRQRIQVYRKETVPVLDFYRERGLLANIPGTGSAESVHQRVLAALGQGTEPRAPGFQVTRSAVE
jgi:adenylate kinase